MGWDSLMQGKGLLGMGLAQPPAGLLGQYYDPKQMRQQKLLMGLQGAGLALLQNGKGSFGEVLGQGATGFAQGANQAGDDYFNNAFKYSQIAQQQKELDEKEKRREQQRGFVMDYAAKKGPEWQAWAEAYPEEAAKEISGLMNPEQLKPTDDMQEYQHTLKDPAFGEYLTGMKKAGAQNITVGGGKYGTIPPGYELVETPTGAQLRAIPGGPAAAEEQKLSDVAESRGNKQMTLTDTITGAASKARKLISGKTTGLVGQGMSVFGPTDAAEVYRQTEVLKSAATIENLNAMRRESPTGGALGNVTEKEGAMLAAAAGAIDPSAGAERYKAALDNYEMTLLRIVHGYDVGSQIFQQTREQDTGGWTTLPNGVKIRKK